MASHQRKKSTLEVQGAVITALSGQGDDFISLTDIARFKNPRHIDDLVRNWLRNHNIVEFLGLWERLNNPDFNPVEFDGFGIQAGDPGKKKGNPFGSPNRNCGKLPRPSAVFVKYQAPSNA